MLPKFSKCRFFVLLESLDEEKYGWDEGLFAFDEVQIWSAQAQPDSSSIQNFLPGLKGGWKFGFLTYDYKNRVEELRSSNPDRFHLPDFCFFEPGLVLKKKQGNWEPMVNARSLNEQSIQALVSESLSNTLAGTTAVIDLRARFSKQEYIRRVSEIQKRIAKGEVYELNFCQEFYADQVSIDPCAVYERLKKNSAAPFAAFCRFDQLFLICSSPERFLKKTADRILSQPIKGTRKRGATAAEDAWLKSDLQSDEKEVAENVMIVDLVRNDLTRIAQRSTVAVEELCKVYSFQQVHQLISTVSCTLKPEQSLQDILKAVFPMGSMTGAPKIRAMELIEEYENTKRGLYSGTLGYITPEGDFDFNVVIRSILYDAEKQYLSFLVGSAITAKSDPEKEYEECLIKARGMLDALNARIV
jgi:para-aminobenzoate synthetase component 1